MSAGGWVRTLTGVARMLWDAVWRGKERARTDDLPPEATGLPPTDDRGPEGRSDDPGSPGGRSGTV